MERDEINAVEMTRESDFNVEPAIPPIFIVETVNVDTTRVLPCAVDVILAFPISVDTVADDTTAVDP